LKNNIVGTRRAVSLRFTFYKIISDREYKNPRVKNYIKKKSVFCINIDWDFGKPVFEDYIKRVSDNKNGKNIK